MTTTINNDLRVFQVISTGWSSRQIFCNIEQLHEAIKSLPANEPFSVYHFWNNKAKRCSRKYIKEFLEAASLPFDWVK